MDNVTHRSCGLETKACFKKVKSVRMLMDDARWMQEVEALLFAYLQGIFGANGQHLVFEVAELAAPGASLTDPADETRLMGAAH